MLGQAAQTFRTSFARLEATSSLVVVRSPSHRRMQELQKQACALLRWSAATFAPYPPHYPRVATAFALPSIT